MSLYLQKRDTDILLKCVYTGSYQYDFCCCRTLPGLTANTCTVPDVLGQVIDDDDDDDAKGSRAIQSSKVPKWGRAICRPVGLDHNAGPSAIPCGSSQSWILNGNLRDFFYKSRNIPDCCSIYICGV